MAKKKTTANVNVQIAEIERFSNMDTIEAAISPSIEDAVNSPQIYNMIDFVNVADIIGSGQTNAPAAPAQITGLVVTPISNSQLNLAWTASGSPGFAYYNVYRGTLSGSESYITSPIPNSYSDTGLSAGTQYFYKVSATNTSSQEGILSAEANGTTTGSPPPPSAFLDMSLNNDYTDATGLNTTFNRIAAGNTAFATPGKFGSHYAQLNIPSIPVSTTPDHIGAIDNTNCQLDFTNGFSFSLWVKPSNIASTGHDRVILMKEEAGVGRQSQVWIGIDPSGRLFGDVFRFSTATDYHKRDTVAISTAAFTHVVVTFNPSTNTLLLYKDKVSQATAGALTIANQSSQYTNLTLGHEAQNADISTYAGAIDELKYYKTVLTQTQVNNLFASNTP